MLTVNSVTFVHGFVHKELHLIVFEIAGALLFLSVTV